MFSKEGLACSEEWLMFGKGPSPFLMKENPSSSINPAFLEMEYFEEVNPGSLTHMLPSNDWAPCFYKGDIVGGLPVDTEDLFKSVGALCLFVVSQKILLGKLLAGSKKDLFSIQQKSALELPGALLVDASFTKAYEIVWTRKRRGCC